MNATPPAAGFDADAVRALIEDTELWWKGHLRREFHWHDMHKYLRLLRAALARVETLETELARMKGRE